MKNFKIETLSNLQSEICLLQSALALVRHARRNAGTAQRFRQKREKDFHGKHARGKMLSHYERAVIGL
jgi:hypothetical protein